VSPARDPLALFKGCLLTTVALTIVLFFFRLYLARAVVIWFGGISFILVFLKKELLRLAFKSGLQTQYRRRFILVGTGDETPRCGR